MRTVLIVIHLMIVMGLIGVVLLQRSEGGGLGVGQAGGFLTSRGTANVLTRTTAILAAGFFLMSLTLSVVAGWDRKPRSILQGTGSAPVDQAPAPTGPAVPLGNAAGNPPVPTAPAPAPGPTPAQRPSGPQVPR
jgi:preprotein translocase subunit SecG